MHDAAAILDSIIDQHGVFLRSEAIALGLDDRTIARGCRAGLWVRVRHGAYTTAARWTGGGPEGQLVTRTRAVARVLGHRVAASHQSAVVLHGIDQWDLDLSRAHVTRLDGGAGRTESDVHHHEGLCLPEDLVEVHGVRTVVPARAVLETASLAGVERGLVVADAALRQGKCTLEELRTQHRLMSSWPAARPLQLVTRMADGRSGSAGESRSRFYFWRHDIPMPELQWEIRDGGLLVAVSDFAWPSRGLLGEFDGREKYTEHLRPGEAPGDAVFREKQREDLIRRLTGWRVVRLVWRDLYDDSAARAIRQMLREAA